MDNGITLQFSEDDLIRCQSEYKRDFHTTANHMVEYLRALEKQEPPKGREALKHLIDSGIINITTFSMFMAALENINEPYEISIV